MGDTWWEQCFALSLRVFMPDVGTELAKKRGLGSLQPPSFLRGSHPLPLALSPFPLASTFSDLLLRASSKQKASCFTNANQPLSSGSKWRRRPIWQQLGCFLPETPFFFPSPHVPPGSATQRWVEVQDVLYTRPREAPPPPPRSVRSVLVLFVEIKRKREHEMCAESAVGDELSVDGGEHELF